MTEKQHQDASTLAAIAKLKEIRGENNLQKLLKKQEEERIPTPLSYQEMKAKIYPKIDQSIGGLMPCGGLGLIVAEPKSYKSFISMCLARDYGSQNKMWLDKFPLQGGKVVYITDDSESTEQQFFSRTEILDFQGNEKVFFINPKIMDVDRIDICDPLIYASLKESLAKLELKSTDLIIWDSWSRFFTGDENKVAEVSKIINYFRSISPATKIIIHHLRKASHNDSVSDFSRIRGSGDILGAVDMAMMLTTKAKGIIAVDTKCRYFDSPEKFAIKMDYKDNGCLDFVYSGDTIEKKNEMAVLKMLGDGGLLRTKILELCEKANIPKQRATETLSRLYAKKLVTKSKVQPNNQTLYKLK